MKNAIKRVLPQRYLSHRVRAHQRNLARDRGVPALASRVIAAHGRTVLHGPIAGLTYPEWLAETDSPVAKLLGNYERELHPVLEQVIERRPGLVVDIGAADGYYAVGLARRLPEATVVAFELDPFQRKRGQELARVNGVGERIVWHGICTEQRLAELDLEGAFVLSDCEGAEAEIFSERSVSALRDTTLLIELHDQQLGTDGFELISGRLRATHEATKVADRAEDVSYDELKGLSDRERALALAEFRGGATPWGLFTPRRKVVA